MAAAITSIDSQTKQIPIQEAQGARVQQAGDAKELKGAQAVALSIGDKNGQQAYAKHAPAQDAALLKEQQESLRNMDIVLSHTLSPEDCEQAHRDGYHPSEFSREEATTIVDHIKASLALSGAEIRGVTDDLTKEQLAQITGSEALAESMVHAFRENDIPLTKENIDSVREAAEKASALSVPSDESIYYLIENEMTPSVDNLYLAAHSAQGRGSTQGAYFAEAGGYLSQQAKETDLSAMQGQIDEVIRRAGYDPADAAAQKEARGLLQAGVTLTDAHLDKAMQLRRLEIPPQTERVVSAGAAAIAQGEKASAGNLTQPDSLLRKAAQIDADMRAVTDEGVRLAVARQREAEREGHPSGPLTLRELSDATRQAKEAALPGPEKPAADAANAQTDARLLQTRLQLEEVRLSMSISVNMSMLRRGVAIDTTPMTALIGELRQAMEQQANALFRSAAEEGAASLSFSASFQAEGGNALSGYRLYAETNLKVAYLRQEMPVGVIGALKEEFQTDTLDDIFTGATTWKTANAAYDAMQTEVRRDLGDSIKKAFRNADELLKDIGMQADEDSLRAVRILGYNRMEVTRENVLGVSAFDAKLNAVLEDLKPAAVLDLIRSGKNPLQMTLDELSQALKEQEGQSAGTDEKYARFLYKLEQAGEITQAERDSYIGIYRMFETLRRTDHAAIGTLLHTGAQMTVRNLLTATRSMKTADGAGIDVRADASFAGMSGGVRAAIDTQIEAAFRYYSAEADIAFAGLEPEKLKALSSPEDALLPEFARQMETLPEDAALNRAYLEERQNALRGVLQQAAEERGETAEHLLETNDMNVTASNLEAMRALQASGKRGAAKTLWESAGEITSDTETDDIKHAADSLLEELGESENYADIYEQGMDKLQQVVENQMLSNETNYVPYRELSLLHRQFGMARHMAGRGSFAVPVEVDGRTVSMEVTLAADEGQGAGVRISLATESYGTLLAQLRVEGSRVSGTLATDFGESPLTRASMEALRTRLSGRIADAAGALSLNTADCALLYGVTQLPERGGERGTSSGTLFALAKRFTEAVTLA